MNETKIVMKNNVASS